MGGHGADHVGLVADLGCAGIGWPAVGLCGAAGYHVGGHEAMQAGGGEVVDGGQPDAPRDGKRTRAEDLHGAGDQQLAIVAAALAAGGRVLRSAVTDRALVDLDQARQGGALGRHHGPAQLGAEQPGRLIRAEPEQLLQLQGRDAVGMGGHQIGRPEPGGERQLGAVQDGAGLDRGLAPATPALIGPRLGPQRPGLGVATGRAGKAVGPAQSGEVVGAGRVIGKTPLKVHEGAGIVRHGTTLQNKCSLFVLPCQSPAVINISWPRQGGFVL